MIKLWSKNMNLKESMRRFRTKNLQEQLDVSKKSAFLKDLEADINSDSTVSTVATDPDLFNPFPVRNPEVGLIFDLLGSIPILSKPSLLIKSIKKYNQEGKISDNLTMNLLSVIPFSGNIIDIQQILKKLKTLNND